MREWRWREAVVPALYGVAVLLTFRQYGVTWDESVQRAYGELALRYFTGRGSLAAIDNFYDLRFYGPLFETIAAAASRLAPAHPYEARHLLVAITGIAAVVGAGRFARYLGVRPELAQLFLVLNPQFYGHSFNNSKDMPLACAVVFTMVALARLAAPEEVAVRAGRPGRGAIMDVLFLSLALGAALSIRIGAILIVAVAAVAFALARRWRLLVPLGIATLLAWILTIALWPSAHQHPIAHSMNALQISRAFPFVPPVLFEGHLMSSAALPRRYLVEMFAITMPMATLLLAILGALFLALNLRALVMRPRSPRLADGREGQGEQPATSENPANQPNRASVLLLLCWAVIPFIAFAMVRPIVYDGIRHFLFVVPALAVLAAAGIEALPRYRAAAVAIAVAAPLIAMIRLHPYQSTYYNAFAGGTRGAARRFETDYWAASYRAAALWLDAHRCPGRPTRVLVGATAYSLECLTYYLPRTAFVVARIQVGGKSGPVPPQFDYYVSTTRYGWAANYAATPIAAVVGRDKAVFTVIRGGCQRYDGVSLSSPAARNSAVPDR